MMKWLVLITAMLLMACGMESTTTDEGENYDLVIANARVIDPASGTDAVLNIGVADGTIKKLTTEEIGGATVIEAAGKIASPGFIDVHSHSPFPFGEAFQVRDGVTTILDLEAGAHPQAGYGLFLGNQARANFGSSVGHPSIRIKAIEGLDQPYMFMEDGARAMEGPAFVEQATPEQIEEMRKMLNDGLDQGGLGIALALDYMSPAVSDDELRMIFEVAADRQAPIWAHIRRGVAGDIAGLTEVLALSRELGAPLHICHINANAMGQVANWLEAIDEANANGADVTTEVFPYTAGSTGISADVFSRDWQTIFDITYEDVQWSETGEWFTEESWEEKRRTRPESFIIHHYMKEEWLEVALRYPDMIVSSDAMPALSEDVKANPNLAGTFTRLLAKFVRDEGVLSIQDAIAKGSYFPARRLETIAPAFAKKGRIQEGADADILIFDLEALQDNATYTEPYQASTGWSYIIVGGEVVVVNDVLTENRPGVRVTAR